MPCYKPLIAWKNTAGEVRFGTGYPGTVPVNLPCNQCIGCRIDRTRSWTVRCIHEAQVAGLSSFVTLTYDNEHLPSGGSLQYRDFQLFMKRLRVSQERNKLKSPRFFMCGEYGEKTNRPHYHALLFGYFPDDRVPEPCASDFPFWQSGSLTKLWGLGRVNFGLVTPETAGYVAGYCTKKVTGEAAENAYTRVDTETGEIHTVTPEFGRMSLKPGIGAKWLDKYGKSDVYAHDRVIINGRKFKTPKYYDDLWEKHSPGIIESLKNQRLEKALLHFENNTDARLAVRETCAKARLSRKEKTL